jgi:hypothetical protein
VWESVTELDYIRRSHPPSRCMIPPYFNQHSTRVFERLWLFVDRACDVQVSVGVLYDDLTISRYQLKVWAMPTEMPSNNM